MVYFKSWEKQTDVAQLRKMGREKNRGELIASVLCYRDYHICISQVD